MPRAARKWARMIAPMVPHIDLSAPHLFGNDAAEDEDLDIFLTYVVDRPEVALFLEPNRRVAIARAYKGEGKSALLRVVQTRLEQGEDAPLIIAASAKQISPAVASLDTDAWVREWKRALLQVIARELGTRIGMAWGDDAITLVEEAEQAGFKSRSVVSSIVDRLKSKAVPIERTRAPAVNPEKIVQRWATRTDGIWLFIDDADENFRNTAEYRAKVASFFLAAREIANAIPQVRLRLAVRPNTWTTLAYDFEALSKVAQYNIDLRWTEPELRDVLAARIRGYLVRTAQWEAFASVGAPRADDLIALLFETPVPWGGGGKQRPVHVPLVTLSRRRPRWLIELARVAADAAHKIRHAKVLFPDVTGRLEAFGKQRIADTVAEFSPQCPQVEELIAAFSRQPEEYATNELMDTISKRILPSVTPKIVGVPGDPRAIDVAAFLFQIGFLSARRQLDAEQYEHLTYSDQPELLRARTNVDDGVRWEIHPVFRQALHMRDAMGRPLRLVPSENRGRR